MNLSADTIFNVIFGLYAGLFTWLLFITKSQVKLVKEQTAQKDATIEYLKQVNKKLQEDTDPVKWKAKLDLNREIAEEEITHYKQLKDSESKKKVLVLRKFTKLVTVLQSTEQELTELQNQHNNLIVMSELAKLEKLEIMTTLSELSSHLVTPKKT